MMVHESRKSGQVFNCPHDGCCKKFAYESTLRKHVASQHKPTAIQHKGPIAESSAFTDNRTYQFENAQVDVNGISGSNEEICQSGERADQDMEPKQTENASLYQPSEVMESEKGSSQPMQAKKNQALLLVTQNQQNRGDQIELTINRATEMEQL